MGCLAWARDRLAVRDRCGGAASHQRQQGSRIAADPRAATERPAQHRCRLLPDQPAEAIRPHSPTWTRHSIRQPTRSTPRASCHRCTRSWAVGKTPSRRTIPRHRRSALRIGNRYMRTGRRPRAGSTLWPPAPTSRCRREKSQMHSRFFRLTATRCVSGHQARPAGPRVVVAIAGRLGSAITAYCHTSSITAAAPATPKCKQWPAI